MQKSIRSVQQIRILKWKDINPVRHESDIYTTSLQMVFFLFQFIFLLWFIQTMYTGVFGEEARLSLEISTTESESSISFQELKRPW